MTINTTSITSGPYLGNDVSDKFSYGFRVEDKTQVLVYETDDTGGVNTLVVDTDYTVGGIGDDGGGILTRVDGPLPSGYEWYIRSNYQGTQLTAFNSQGGFFPGVHEDAFDKLTFLIQQLGDSVDRSLKFSNGYSGDLEPVLPEPDSGKFLRWKSDLSGMENVLLSVVSDVVSVSAQSILNYDSNLETAVAEIGSVETTLLIDTTPKNLTGDLVVPSNISLVWYQGCVLSGAYTITINGSFEAGRYQVFGNNLTVILRSGVVPVIVPEWHTTNDVPGTTDMTLAIQWAIDTAAVGRPATFFQATTPTAAFSAIELTGLYKITDTIKMYSLLTLDGKSMNTTCLALAVTDRPIIYTGHNNDDDCLNFTASGQKISGHLAIKNMSLRGSNNLYNAHTANTILNHGITVDGLFRSHIENINMSDLGGYGLFQTKAEWMVYKNITVQLSRRGLCIDGAQAAVDKTIFNNVTNKFEECRFWANHQGISLNLTSNNIFDRCISESSVGSIYNATTNGEYDGTELQPDEYYLPSVNLNLEETFSNTFNECYFEAAYIDLYNNGAYSNTFNDCFFNPTDDTDVTAGTGVENCSRHDILYRQNLVDKVDPTDGDNNQALVVFAAGGAGTIFNGPTFYNSPNSLPASNKSAYKRVRFIGDLYLYPTFNRCYGLNFDDGTTVFTGISRITLIPASGSDTNLDELSQVKLLTGEGLDDKPTGAGANIVGSFLKKVVYNGALANNNIAHYGYYCQGSGDQRDLYLPMNKKIGNASAAPTSGTWSLSDVIYNSAPAATGVMGWVCVVAGTPGTWKSWGTIAV